MTDTPKRPVKKSATVNIWKWLFLILLGLMLGTGIFLGTKLFVEPTPTTTAKTVSRSDEPVFSVEMTKSQVNRIVAFYLKNYLKDNDQKYQFKLTDQAVLTGQFKFLGAKIPFTLNFEPYVLENGDVQLKAKQLAIGALPVPVSTVLSFVGNDYNLPKWVTLSSKQETVTIHLSQYRTDNGMSFKADHIDLDNDKIDFSAFISN
ncbi:YpmS family protein [Lapidilactobacillus bayanensis]|uniref:YpmS family protein n=1 Tax=Lapidilactobacillus bayanensis TaxID=2485998 RepID=UPI000F7676D9|nr:YpmS family protein [Lapidilactobacillus bayanensis]